jgi:hypothetical protein
MSKRNLRRYRRFSFFLDTSLPQQKGGGVGSERAAAAAAKSAAATATAARARENEINTAKRQTDFASADLLYFESLTKSYQKSYQQEKNTRQMSVNMFPF